MSSELTALTNRLLSEVGEREPLSLEEELRLARLVTEGRRAAERLADPGLPEGGERRGLEETAAEGRGALSVLLAHNLPLVVQMTHRYRWSGVPILDLFQEGVLGLLRAAERFDWTRGTPFGAYASWWVRHAMSKAVRDATTSVRLSDDARSSLRRLARERDADRSVSWRVLAERAGVDADDAETLLPLLGPPLSLDAGAIPGADVTLEDVLADREAEEEMEGVLVSAEVDRLWKVADRTLEPRERHVLEARYGLGGLEPRTLREVGEELGLTPQRVAQIEERTLQRLRDALGIDDRPSP
jgi:RNA polymerase primary sigma factor